MLGGVGSAAAIRWDLGGKGSELRLLLRLDVCKGP